MYLDYYYYVIIFYGNTKSKWIFLFQFSDVRSGRTSFIFVISFQIYLHSFPNDSSTLFDLYYLAFNFEVNNNDNHIINVV